MLFRVRKGVPSNRDFRRRFESLSRTLTSFDVVLTTHAKRSDSAISVACRIRACDCVKPYRSPSAILARALPI